MTEFCFFSGLSGFLLFAPKASQAASASCCAIDNFAVPNMPGSAFPPKPHGRFRQYIIGRDQLVFGRMPFFSNRRIEGVKAVCD